LRFNRLAIAQPHPARGKNRRNWSSYCSICPVSMS
jgi:hypothetical protein